MVQFITSSSDMADAATLRPAHPDSEPGPAASWGLCGEPQSLDQNPGGFYHKVMMIHQSHHYSDRFPFPSTWFWSLFGALDPADVHQHNSNKEKHQQRSVNLERVKGKLQDTWGLSLCREEDDGGGNFLPLSTASSVPLKEWCITHLFLSLTKMLHLRCAAKRFIITPLWSNSASVIVLTLLKDNNTSIKLQILNKVNITVINTVYVY